MTWTVEGSELGIQDCDFVASGEKIDVVLRKIVDHLREVHNIDMPDVDVILEGKATDDPLGEADEDVALIVQRLIEELNIEPPPTTDQPGSPIPPPPRATSGNM